MQAAFWEQSDGFGRRSTAGTRRTIKRIQSHDFLNKCFLSDMKYVTLPQQSAAKNSASNQAYQQVMLPDTKATTFDRCKIRSHLVSDRGNRSKVFKPEQKSKSLPASAFLKQLPQNYYDVTPHDMIRLVSDMVEELVDQHAVLSTVGSHRLSRFHSQSIPPISVLDYLQRLQRYIRLSSPAILVIMLYLKRLCHAPTSICLSRFTIHRLLLTCAAISIKVMTDYLCSNKLHARAGGVRSEELTFLEVDLLQALRWDVIPRDEDLAQCYLDLVNRNGGYVLFACEPGDQTVRLEIDMK